MLVVVINHEKNDEAMELVEGFRPYADVYAIDSGSQLDERHRRIFDETCPNIYYSGLINRAVEALQRRGQHQSMLWVASDVRVNDYGLMIACARDAMDHPGIGMYAPSAEGSSHGQMRCKKTGRMRRVAFTDGFCFAARLSLLERLYPVDTDVNYLGHGLDIYLGFLAMQENLRVVVDDRITVIHPPESGYDSDLARRQRFAWLAQKSGKPRRFHWWASRSPCKTPLGLLLLRAFHSIHIL